MKDQSGQTPREEVSAGAGTRKPYESPKLRVYGDVAAITRSVGMTAAAQADGGAHGNTKTH
jgi:hypothetical protein